MAFKGKDFLKNNSTKFYLHLTCIYACFHKNNLRLLATDPVDNVDTSLKLDVFLFFIPITKPISVNLLINFHKVSFEEYWENSDGII